MSSGYPCRRIALFGSKRVEISMMRHDGDWWKDDTVFSDRSRLVSHCTKFQSGEGEKTVIHRCGCSGQDLHSSEIS